MCAGTAGRTQWKKDLKKLQQREQHMLEKLAEARMRQARAMERFTLVRTRVLRAEKRFQALHERFTREEDAPSDEMAPDVLSSAETLQEPAHEDALIAAILAITQTEPSSLPADSPSSQEGGEAVQQAQHPEAAADLHVSGTEEADTTDRLPVVHQQHSCEPD
jgi:hypothetical protein